MPLLFRGGACQNSLTGRRRRNLKWAVLMDRTELKASSHGPSSPPAMLVGLYGLFDFLAPAIIGSLLEGDRGGEYIAICLVAAITGCALAQFGALAAWGVMGTGRPISRWTGSLATAAVLFSLLYLGASLGRKDAPRWQELFDPLRALPLAYLSVQAPLWTMGLGWGYRIVAAGTVAPTPRRFTLRGLFFATAVIAATLALVQVGQPAELRGETVVVIAICLVAGSAWGILAVLPCLLSAFLSSTPDRGVAFLLAYVAVLSLVLLGALLAFGGRGPLPEALGVAATCGAFCGASALTLFVSFLVLRNDGYKLRRIKIEQTTSQA